MSRAFTALAIHAERLDSDVVWDRFSSALARLESARCWATVFVSTFWPRFYGCEIDRRLDELTARGHEIAQHTHYYVPPDRAAVAGYKKQVDLSRENVEASLNADYEYLAERGHSPEGFVAGAWAVSSHAQAWLQRHGFRYDCTMRSYGLRYPNEAAAAGSFIRTISAERGVLDLPTTAPLKRGLASVFLARHGTIRVGEFRYRLWYAHDYDFASVTGELAARLLGVLRRGRMTTVGQLADFVVGQPT